MKQREARKLRRKKINEQLEYYKKRNALKERYKPYRWALNGLFIYGHHSMSDNTFRKNYPNLKYNNYYEKPWQERYYSSIVISLYCYYIHGLKGVD